MQSCVFLSLDETDYNSKPIAVIKKNSEKKIIYINEAMPSKKFEDDIMKTINVHELLKKVKLGRGDLRMLKYDILAIALKNNSPPKNVELEKIFNKLKYIFLCNLRNMIASPNSTCSIIPDMDSRQIGYICGPSGSGKSFFVSRYAENYKRLDSSRMIYVISKIENDASFNFEYEQIPVDDIANGNFSASNFNNSLIIFDDTDTLKKDLKKSVHDFKVDILNTGRHYNLSCLITSHRITNREQTKDVLGESHFITVFPNRTIQKDIRYLFYEYIGLNIGFAKKIKKYNSRAVTIFKTSPMYIVFNNGVELINNDA